MTIKELEGACYLYERFTNFDKGYKKLWDVKELNLSQKDHIVSLIQWLRSWGCRQFKIENDEMSIQNLMNWYSSYSIDLPDCDLYLLYSSENIFNKSAGIFDKLSNTKISEKQHNDRKINVSVGPAGAAKILFALRPNFYSPWDRAIREKKQYKPNGNSYVKYLNDIKETLAELQIECKQNGFDISELPQKLNRKISTLPKIIDEYNWITITKKIDPLDILKLSATRII